MKRTTVHDGIINGRLEEHACDFCGSKATAVQVWAVVLPEGIEVKNTILKSTDPKKTFIEFLGITCGCYAKLHRQVAHIQSKMESRENAKKRVAKMDART
jgi:hypothetical protein